MGTNSIRFAERQKVFCTKDLYVENYKEELSELLSLYGYKGFIKNMVNSEYFLKDQEHRLVLIAKPDKDWHLIFDFIEDIDDKNLSHVLGHLDYVLDEKGPVDLLDVYLNSGTSTIYSFVEINNPQNNYQLTPVMREFFKIHPKPTYQIRKGQILKGDFDTYYIPDQNQVYLVD